MRKSRMIKWLLSLAVGIFILIDLIPIFFTLITSFKTKEEYVYNIFSLPSHWSFDNYSQLF